MRSPPLLAPRTARALVALLLCVKLVLLIWNAATFDARDKDADYHADRALSAGLSPSNITHDGPTYYLAAKLKPRPDDVPLVARATSGEDGEPEAVASAERPKRVTRAEKEFRADLLDWLRYTNVLWLGVFYAAWIYWSFPRLLPSSSSWLLASLLLLSLPGIQRVGVMAHPDNALLGSSALAVAGWLWLREQRLASEAERRVEPTSPFGPVALFALLIGVLATTRWLAVVPSLVLAIVCAVYAARSARGNPAQLVARVLAALAISSALGATWYTAVVGASHEPGSAHTTSYFPTFDHPAERVIRPRYYTSFRWRALLDPDSAEGGPETAAENSFLTLLYSDTWGDQWSTFSGPKARGAKNWAKRVILGWALAVPPLSLGLAVAALAALWKRVREQRARSAADKWLRRLLAAVSAFEAELVLLALVVLGFVGFAVWQARYAYFADDNSTVRFGSFGWLLPAALALLFRREPTPWGRALMSGYFLSLYCFAFPLAMYWPS